MLYFVSKHFDVLFIVGELEKSCYRQYISADFVHSHRDVNEYELKCVFVFSE